jgi:transcriptional regulator with GAF, ATPase, and Fis domain
MNPVDVSLQRFACRTARGDTRETLRIRMPGSEKALRQADGNLREAAKLLNLNPTYIYRLVNRLGLAKSASASIN